MAFILIIYIPVTGANGIMKPDGTGSPPNYRTMKLDSRRLLKLAIRKL
jgi:hypothetical protein